MVKSLESLRYRANEALRAMDNIPPMGGTTQSIRTIGELLDGEEPRSVENLKAYISALEAIAFPIQRSA